MTHRLITVRQPWARPIVERGGIKNVENRGTGFTRKHRGRLWIHAGAALAKPAFSDERIRDLYPRLAGPWEVGSVIGYVNTVDAHIAEPGCCESIWAEQEYVGSDGSVQRNPVHLVFEDAVELAEPIPCRGALGIWSADRVPGLAESLDHADEVREDR